MNTMQTRSTAKRQRTWEEDLQVMQQAPINKLPDECFFLIFSFLDEVDRLRSTAVCKRWRNFGPAAWKDVEKLDLITNRPLQKEYSRLFSLCGNSLKELSFPVLKSFEIIRLARATFTNLRKVRFRFGYFYTTKSHLQKLARLFRRNKSKLRSVCIENIVLANLARCKDLLPEVPEGIVELELRGACDEWRRCSTQAPFRHLIPGICRLKELKTLVVEGLYIDDDYELAFIQTLKELRQLTIWRCSERHLNYDVIANHTQLEYLSLGITDHMGGQWFRDLVRNSPNLRHLKLQTVDRIRPGAYQKLRRLTNLETLVLVACHGTHPWEPSWSFDFTGFPHLKHVDCTDMTESALTSLIHGAPQVEFIRLRNRSTMNIQALRKVHEVICRRDNNITLRMVIPDTLVEKWEKESQDDCSLLIVERETTYVERTGGEFEAWA